MGMAHGIEDRAKLLALTYQLRSQAEVIERALEGEGGREEVLDLAASANDIVKEFIAELSKDHDQVDRTSSTER